MRIAANRLFFALALALLSSACGGSSAPADPSSSIPAPTGLAVTTSTVLGKGEAHVTWSAVTGATYYVVTYAVGSIAGAPPGFTTTLNEARLTALAPGQTYQVAVAAGATAGTGVLSAAVTVTPPVPPAPPTQVEVADAYSTEGVLDQVRVSWTASPDPPPSYLVFRSTDDGVTWTERGSTAGTTFEDTLPVEDLCTRLRYRVASAKPSASSARSTDEALRGTLLQSSTSAAEFETVPASSPYFVQDSVSLDHAFVRVQPQTLLCLEPSSTLSLVDGANFLVYGMLRAVGTAVGPVTITGHAPGGGAAVSGYFIGFGEDPRDPVSPHYDPVSGRGTLLDHVSMTRLPSLGLDSRLRVHQSRLTALQDGTGVAIWFGGPSITDSTFDGFILTVAGPFAGSPTFAIHRNVFRLGSGFPLNFGGSVTTPAPSDAIGPGQITGNAFPSGLVGASGFTASGDFPLGGNHWGGDSPELHVFDPKPGITITAAFDPLLATAPAAGATW